MKLPGGVLLHGAILAGSVTAIDLQIDNTRTMEQGTGVSHHGLMISRIDQGRSKHHSVWHGQVLHW